MNKGEWNLAIQENDLLIQMGIRPKLLSPPAIISTIKPNSPASTANLKVGDKILQADETIINNMQDINNYIYKKSFFVCLFLYQV